MRSYKIEGIVIKRTNFGEADRMLTVFTKDQGKISIKASGIRRIPSRRSAHVELLNHVNLTLYRGQHISTLTEAQTIENFSGLKEDLQKIGFCYHICELVNGLCAENQEHSAVFYLLRNTLVNLSEEKSENLAPIIHEFEVELLTLLGFWNKRAEESPHVNLHAFIESLLEKKLKSKNIFQKIND